MYFYAASIGFCHDITYSVSNRHLTPTPPSTWQLNALNVLSLSSPFIDQNCSHQRPTDSIVISYHFQEYSLPEPSDFSASRYSFHTLLNRKAHRPSWCPLGIHHSTVRRRRFPHPASPLICSRAFTAPQTHSNESSRREFYSVQLGVPQGSPEHRRPGPGRIGRPVLLPLLRGLHDSAAPVQRPGAGDLGPQL